MKIIIVGGVAGGASAAARAARLDSKAEIILFERGQYISFANCGLPYHVGNVIQQRDSLLVMTPEALKARSGIDARIRQEVIALDPAAKSVRVRKLDDGTEYAETYDKLILATGSSPAVPPVPGADDPDVLPLWTIPDMDKVKSRIDKGIKHAVVAGGGFIGLEVAENLVERGVETVMVQRPPQVMPALDPEMASMLTEMLEKHGVKVYLNNALTAIRRTADGLAVTLKDGSEIRTQMVVMGLGVHPNSELGRDAGLELNERGGIKVNSSLRTSNPDIYAVGDVIEVNDPVLDKPVMIPLAGPASRQGRIAANNIFGAGETYKGSLGANICKVFELAAASVGVNEKRLIKENIPFLKTYIIPSSHASYYPGAAPLFIKLLFEQSGRILGAQAVGADGVDKRIDVLATAMRGNLKVQDLEELELAYAPPYSSAKDPVNFAGFVANNIIKGDSRVVAPDAIPQSAFVLDVRENDEFVSGAIPGAVNIPLGELRDNFDKLPKDRLIVTQCRVGLRGYLAERLLRDNGFDVKNLSGGYLGWKLFQKNEKPQPCVAPANNAGAGKIMEPVKGAVEELNVCGLQCPGPIVQVKKSLEKAAEGKMLKVIASDAGFYNDLPAWCQATGNSLISIEKKGGNVEAVIVKGQGGSAQATPVAQTGQAAEKRATIVLFSNDLDKAMAAFIIATGFAALGQPVSIFFTFWGLNVLRKEHPPAVKKDILSRMFGFMMPRGAKKLALSKMRMLGAGTAMMKYVMASKNVDSLPQLIAQARTMGIEFLACEMAMNVMGIKQEELLDGVETTGVANFAALSARSTTTLFI
jgi:NADPH-dependent 2,4-dienoyl-CoA reductase/sulfur reductase-like enzyme/peroxiredoxin family protein/rhodanese-related sulfurtransferase/TusA-related sulfurtransferase